MSEDLHAQLVSIYDRRLEAFRESAGLRSEDKFKAMADAVTRDDLRTISDAIESLGAFGKAVVIAACDLERDYAKGYRCGVCGRTAAQSAAIGYDCAREC